MKKAGQSMISTHFDDLGTLKRGKVRDVYFNERSLTIICCDRISVFDRILPTPIPDKGKILNLLAKYWFDQSKEIIPNHIIDVPDPNVTIAKRCTPIPIEVVVRGYIAGSMWRDYAKGNRMKCGATLPDGLCKHDPLPHPIITPTTKNNAGHDIDIAPKDMIEQGIITSELWDNIVNVSLELFRLGSHILANKGMTLVDTKYEFGIDQEGVLTLIDEIHTPDSSRFWFQDDPSRTFKDKEFTREWAAAKGFTGEGDPPEIPVEIQQKIREGYAQIFKTVTGNPVPQTDGNMQERIRSNLIKAGYLNPVEAQR